MKDFFFKDQDADGVLLYDEFKSAAMGDWLLIEAFGQCLPDYGVSR